MPTIPTFVNVKAGDAVTVRIHNGAAVVVGVEGGGDRMASELQAAKTASEEAQAAAQATNQHFFADDNGVHVAESADSADTDHNILLNGLGILLRRFTNFVVAVTESAVSFFDGEGNEDANIVAQFGKNVARIGKISLTGIHTRISSGSFEIIRGMGTIVGHFGYKTFTDAVEEDEEEALTYDSPYLAVGGDIECDNVDAGAIINQSSSGGQCLQRNTRSDLNTRYGRTAPSAIKYISSKYVKDSNNTTISYEQTHLSTAGKLIRDMAVRRYSSDGSTFVLNRLALVVNNSGGREVLISEAKPWQVAILPATTATPTAATGWNASLTVVKRGNVCQLQGTVSSKTGYTSSSGATQVATIPAGYRPAEGVHLLSGVSGVYKGRIYISENGALSIGNVCQGNTYLNNSTSTLTLGATWVCAE